MSILPAPPASESDDAEFDIEQLAADLRTQNAAAHVERHRQARELIRQLALLIEPCSRPGTPCATERSP
jgi:hypothetical protein